MLATLLSIARNLLLSLAGVVIAVLLVELAVRVVGYSPRPRNSNMSVSEYGWAGPDAALGWRNRLGTWKSMEAGNVPMTFLEDGRRRSVPAEKPGATRTILVVGGSHTQGYGVADEETFTSRLNAAHPEILFVNYGAGGYGTAQSMLVSERLLEGGLRETPELVIYGFGANHLRRNISDHSWVRSLVDSSGRYVSPPHFRFEDGALRFTPSSTVGFWPLEEQWRTVALLHEGWVMLQFARLPWEKERVTKRLLQEFAVRVRNGGSELLIAVIAGSPEINAELFSPGRDGAVDCQYERSAAFEVGGDGHPNAQAHQLMSDCISRWITARDESGAGAPYGESPASFD